MFRFCLSVFLVLALSCQGAALAQTNEPDTSTAPNPPVEAESPLGAGLAVPTLAVLGVLGVLLTTTVSQQCLDDAGCGGGPPITATATR